MKLKELADSLGEQEQLRVAKNVIIGKSAAVIDRLRDLFREKLEEEDFDKCRRVLSVLGSKSEEQRRAFNSVMEVVYSRLMGRLREGGLADASEVKRVFYTVLNTMQEYSEGASLFDKLIGDKCEREI